MGHQVCYDTFSTAVSKKRIYAEVNARAVEDGKWYRESLLGKCCVCGEYKELGVSTSKGKMCFECWTNRENR